jgi:hypothetical protein
MEPPQKVSKVANETELKQIARQLALIRPSEIYSEGVQVHQLEGIFHALSTYVRALQGIAQCDVPALQAIQGTLLLWLDSIFTSQVELSSMNRASLFVTSCVCDRLQEIYGWSFSTAVTIVEKEEEEELISILLNVLTISIEDEALNPAVGRVCGVLEMVLRVIEFSQLATDLKKQLILLLIEAHARKVFNAVYVLRYLSRQQSDLHAAIALNAISQQHTCFDRRGCHAIEEIQIFHLQCTTRLCPRSSSLDEKLVELLVNNILRQHETLCDPATDCLVAANHNEALFSLFRESNLEQVKYAAIRGISLPWLLENVKNMPSDILKRSIAMLFLLVVQEDRCITVFKGENIVQKATEILLTILSNLLSHPRDEIPMDDLVAILRALMTSQASPCSNITVVRTLCRETIFIDVIEKHPAVISDVASVVLESPGLLSLFICWLQEVKRHPSFARSLSFNIARQPKVLTTITFAAGTLDWDVRRAVVWILYDLSTFAYNWRILARHPGVLSTMVHFVRDNRNPQLKQRVLQLAEVL